VKDGAVWAWGDNRNGQLGIGSDRHSETVPVEVNIHLALGAGGGTQLKAP
jgi:alpha-tubulin suppressor-like RCC1 family protein